MNEDYSTLDEFLAVSDRETRNIQAEELTNRPQTNSDSRGILKMSSWRASSPTPIVPRIDRQVTFGGTTTYPRPPSPIPIVLASTKTTANSLCNSYGNLGY